MALRFAIGAMAVLLLTFVGMVAVGAAGLFGVYAYYTQSLPTAEEISQASVDTFETTRIYDRTGQVLLYEIIPPNGGRRTWITLDRVPTYLRDATIAMEDKTFYTNPGGINVEGVARAVWGEISGDNQGGGSSIPQQLVRNVIMDPAERMDRSYERKLKEMILSMELTRRYPGVEGRDQILEWYLNNIFYGHFAYGIEAAAQTYFGKSVTDLSLAEAAMLVPLGQAPALNPIDYPEEAKSRQETVLDQMYIQGYITAEEAYAAKQEPITIAPPSFDIKAPHFVLYVRDELEQRFGSEMVYGGGLQVITSIDLDLQDKVQQYAQEHVETLKNNNVHNAAVVVLDNQNAEILSMMGSLDYFDDSIDGQVNMAVSPRQPGSTFKPFTYATAFAQGYTPATMVMDVHTSFSDYPNPTAYVPENYDRTYHGPLLLRRALACSYNIPAVIMASRVGVMNVAATATSMGITTLTQPSYGLALALGGTEVPLIDMAYAFSVFADNGNMVGQASLPGTHSDGQRSLDPVSILSVTNSRGQILYEYTQPQRQEVINPDVAFLVSDILSDNNARTPAFGSSSALVLPDRPAAAKTGTTNDYRDAWTVGYTPQYTVGVWVGNTDSQQMEKDPGSRAAAPIWNAVMQTLHEGLPVENFQRPADIVTEVVDSTSGKLPTDYSPQRMQEVFIKGTEPTEYDDVHQVFQICRASGKLATPYCPADEIEEQVFEIYPDEANDWVREQGIAQPPTDYCDVHGPNLANMEVAIVSPRNRASVAGVLSITGNARPGGMERFWLEYGEGAEPENWIRLSGDRGDRVDNGELTQWDTTHRARWALYPAPAGDGGRECTIGRHPGAGGQHPTGALCGIAF